MNQRQPLREVVDLTKPACNVIFNMALDEARERVASGDPKRVREIEGHFALLARRDHLVRMARSLSVPMRYFVAKRADGPALIVSDRIDKIQRWLAEQGLAEQFHPTYTRMVPAHYITEIALVGCPDPSPTYSRYLSPKRDALAADLTAIGKAYIGCVAQGIAKWVRQIPETAPIGVLFSGGIDSGAVFLLVYDAMLKAGMNLGRLKAFTLSVDGGGADLDQARRFLEAMDLQLFHEVVEVDASDVDYEEAIRVIEDYKPLDVQAAAMVHALCGGIRKRYGDWKYLVDGDGGDENLKDYPIEENPELTIKSVLGNPLLYHEGWGVGALKHSLTYTGGLSRGCTRTYAPVSMLDFIGFSPFMLPDVVEVSEGIPFVELTDWQHDRLYRLKGEIVSRGVEAATGLTMPVYPKRRFQRGAIHERGFAERFPHAPSVYRRVFHDAYRV
ncbi:MAG: asparagine synthase [Planctomycetes bacterium]|nr:asparagine synthase [Planctomycetota bacterium]